jgi:hypothetical protein
MLLEQGEHLFQRIERRRLPVVVQMGVENLDPVVGPRRRRQHGNKGRQGECDGFLPENHD